MELLRPCGSDLRAILLGSKKICALSKSHWSLMVIGVSGNISNIWLKTALFFLLSQWQSVERAIFSEYG
jgi:hypothetical protein